MSGDLALRFFMVATCAAHAYHLLSRVVEKRDLEAPNAKYERLPLDALVDLAIIALGIAISLAGPCGGPR